MSLEKARSRAKAQEWTTKRIIRELPTLDLIDRSFIDHCRSISEELVPSLLEAMHDSMGGAKLNASLLLLHLGERRGTIGIVACLQSGVPDLQTSTILQLTFLPLDAVDEPLTVRRGQPVPLERQPVFAEIRRFLTQPDSRLGSLALQLATKLDLPEAETYIEPLLHYPSRKVQADVLNRSVIKGLNAALADAGYRERFVMLHSGGQTCALTFAPEAAFRQVARELRLPLEDDYQAAMRAGIAFEQYVRRKMAEDERRESS